MKIEDAIDWIIRAIWVQKVRSMLTVLGFSIGIAAMVLLSALGEGLRLFVLNEFTQFGSHIIAINPGKTETFGLSGILNTTRPLSLDDAQALMDLSSVEAVVPVVMGTGEVEAETRARYSDVAGVGHGALQAWKLGMKFGHFLPADDFRSARSLVVLGSELHMELFGDSNPLGQFVRIGGQRFRVVGVLAPKGELLGFDMNQMAFIPAASGLQLFNRDSLMEVDVLYKPGSSSERIADLIRKRLIALHGFEDFTIITQDQMLNTMDNILGILKIAAAGLGGISLLVGAVGITTILMINVNERIPEVGLLRALGGTSAQVRNLFLGEAMVLGLIGGLCGLIAVAFALFIIHQFAAGLPLGISVEVIALALIASLLIGLLAGVSPAMRASRLTPIEALRAE